MKCVCEEDEEEEGEKLDLLSRRCVYGGKQCAIERSAHVVDGSTCYCRPMASSRAKTEQHRWREFSVRSTMKNLFDNADQLVRFQRHVSQQLQIKTVLDPFTQQFVDESMAKNLGILFDGYYRNRSVNIVRLLASIWPFFFLATVD